MATSSGEVFIRIRVTGVDEVNSELGSVKMNVVAINQAVELAKNAFNGMQGVLGKLKTAFIDSNAQMESYLTQFEVMTGSADVARQHLEELKTFGANTPFELPGLAQNSALLQNMGLDVEEVLPTLKMLGDISGGSQVKLDGLALVLGQVRSAGKLTGQDLLQFINQGFNPLQAMAEKSGKSMGQLKEEMSKGQITYEMVREAMVEVTSEGGKFYQMTERQAATWDGMMTTLNDTIGEFLRDAGKPFFEAAKKILVAAQGMLDALGPLKPVITPIIGAVAAASLALVAYSTVTSMATVKTIALAVAQNAMKVAHLVSIGATYAVTAAQWAWNAAMSANPVGLIVLGVGALIAAIVALAKPLVNMLGGWGALNKVLGKVWEYLKIGFDLFLRFGNPIGLMVTGLKALYDNFGFVRDAIDAVIEGITAVAGAIVDAGSWLLDALGISGDEQAKAVDASQKKVEKVVEKSWEEITKEMEAKFNEQARLIDLNEARGVVSKEKAATMKLQLERQYYSDLKTMAEKHGQDAAEFELRAAQAEAKLREEAAKRRKDAADARRKEEDEFTKLRLGNISNEELRIEEQYERDVSKAQDALARKEVSQRIFEQTLVKLASDREKALQKLSDERAAREREEFQRAIAQLQEQRDAEQRVREAEREEILRTIESERRAREIDMGMLPTEMERIRAKYEYEKEQNDRALEYEEISAREHASRRRQIDAEYAQAKADMEIGMARDIFDTLGKMAGEHTILGKAAAVAQASINTYEGATKALSQGGIFGPIMAAVVTGFGMMQVQKILATQVPGRRTGGPVTAGLYQVGEEGTEYVMNARATARNRTLLEAMNSGAPERAIEKPRFERPGSGRQLVEIAGAFRISGRDLELALTRQLDLSASSAF